MNRRFFALEGITADDSGCTIFVGNRVDFKATFQMPIIGGPMEKRGSGIAIFDAAWNAGNLTVTQGSFGFTQGIEIGADCTTFTTLAGATFSADQDQLNGRTMLNNGSFNPAGIGTVGSVTLGSGHTVSNLMFDVSLSDSDCVTLTEAENVTAWPMQIGLTGYGMAQRYPVLKIPTSIRTVTLEDFIDVSVADPREQVTSSIAIETDDDTGIQTVYLCQSFQVINQIVNDKYFTDATAWEDGQAAHAGAAYVTYAKLLRTSVGTANDVTFPGESLYIYGNSGTRADLRIKDKSLTVNDLRMGQKTIVTGGAGSSGVTSQTLYGNGLSCGIRSRLRLMARSGRRQSGEPATWYPSRRRLAAGVRACMSPRWACRISTATRRRAKRCSTLAMRRPRQKSRCAMTV